MAQYDAIVVGGRVAGSPAAMLLARKGYKVLVVDRDTFPSDTLSTHFIHAPGVAALRRWGLADQVAATGCPPVGSYSFDFGPVTISGSPRPVDGNAIAYAPRRIVLDKILVDGAVAAGAEVREGFTVDEVLVDNGAVTGIRGHGRDGKTVTETAKIVIGADGRHSRVAKAVSAQRYNEKPVLLNAYFSYWSNLPADRFEIYIRPVRGFALFPTNDNLTLLVGGWPHAEFHANRQDVEGNFLKMLEYAPEVAERVRNATRQTPWSGAGVENFFRQPYGPGWALVGDAGYNKDPVTACGITDAFRDAELCATAVDEWLDGARSFEEAMADYQTTRDNHALPMYEYTTMLASMEPPPAEMQQLLGAMAGNQDAMDQFVSVNATTMSPAEFFAPENIGGIMAGAGALAAH